MDDHVGAYQGNNIYDFDNEILLNWYPKRILRVAKGKGSLLELGVGHGYSTNVFSEFFQRHLVLDGSSAVIENFKSKFPSCKAEILETYFENFETEERFDLIVLGFILEHVDDPIEILTKYKSYLKEGGSMFVSVPNSEVLNRRLGNKAGLLSDLKELSENDHLLGHKRYYSVDSLESDILKAGFRVKSMEGIYLKPFTTQQIVSLDLDEKIIDALCEVGIDYPELSCGIMAEIEAE